ncbi:MAG: DNA polymerase I [Bryobacterales bacterium]
MAAIAPRLFLIDTFGLIFRAFYGRARAAVPSMRTSSGIPTEAAYIFTTMIRRLLNDHKPEYVAAVWEGEGPTFRAEAFEDYKANREAMPTDLARQMPYIRRLLEASRMPILAHKGYEADDTIATLAKQAAGKGIDVYIVSSDKDLTQLVGGRVFMLNPMKDDLIYTPHVVKELMGVAPEQIIDLLALKGDSVDNIPGAPGIGEKGAQALIAEYGSVENLLDHAGEIKRKTYRESLLENREQVLLSKRLATLATDAPIEVDLEALEAREPDPEALRDLFQELEFTSLLGQMDLTEQKADTKTRELKTAEEFRAWLDDALAKISAAAEEAKASLTPVSIAVDSALGQGLAPGAIAFCARAGEAALLPSDLLPAAKGFLEDRDKAKRVYDSKAAMRTLARQKVLLAGVVDDPMLAAFLADSSRSDYSLAKTVALRFGEKVEGDLGRAADLTRHLGESLAGDLDLQELRKLYEEVELPLAAVLAGMEEAGILVDAQTLASLSMELGKNIDAITREIHAIAGSTFNINSPKQLGKVLFEDLGLPAPVRRGKGKALSTASDVLEGLATAHEIAAKVLDHRQYTKLKNTYVDALPLLIDPQTGRLHTTFNPTGSATGRLSSSNPNLQNIPVRTELGRQIRAAFISRPGWNLLAGDYSQIELRILAHLSGDPTLLDAFRKGEDIHTRTAAEVFGIPPLAVGADERRRAKAVNFGIVYGLSPFGLSQQLGIPQKESRAYIQAYFELYAGVKSFIDGTIEQARESGVSRTMFGRLRPITDLHAKNPAARGFAERTAINSPIQGSAADLIKMAMIRVDRRLRDENNQALMLLQVHDELLFEVPEGETAAVAAMVKKEMEAVFKLKVPLVADIKVGKNWRDMTVNY